MLSNSLLSHEAQSGPQDRRQEKSTSSLWF